MDNLQTLIIKKAKISNSLRQAVKEQNHRFTMQELFLLTARFVKLYADRVALYRAILEKSLEKDLKLWVKKRLAYEEKLAKEFYAGKEGFVYLVSPYGEGVEYVCLTAAEAFAAHDKFIRAMKDVDDGEDFESMITLKKSGMPLGNRPYDALDCENITATIGRNGVYGFDYDKGHLYEEWGKDSARWAEYSVYNNVIFYPPFLKKGDLVLSPYSYAPYKTSMNYGINAFDMPKTRAEAEDNCGCVENLEQPYVRLRACEKKDKDGYYLCFRSHDHPDFAMVEKVDPADAPEDIRDDYEYYLDFMNRVEGEK